MFAWLKRLFGNKSKPSNQWLAEVSIAGLQHYRGNDLAEMIQEGDELELQQQPDNAYDSNAIMVLWKNNKLGYIPASIARDIGRQIAAGVSVKATITEIKPVRFGRKWISVRLEAEKSAQLTN